MGGHSSKQIRDSFRVMPGLTSYEAACQDDLDLLIFNSDLLDRTTRAIRPFAAGVKNGSFSIDSLGDLTETFLDTQPRVVKSILQSRNQIRKNKELLNLVEIYLDSSLKTLEFFTSLKECLDRARHSQSILQSAFIQFKKEGRSSLQPPARYEQTLQQLKNFKAAGDPFSGEFLSLFESIFKQHTFTLNKLVQEKRRLDSKLNSVKAWRKVSKIILVATFAAVMIFTVIAAAIAATPVVAALAVAAAVPLGPIGGWLSSIWTKLEKEIRGESELIGETRHVTFMASEELKSIRAIIDKIVMDMEPLLKTPGFGVKKEEEGLRVAIDVIKKKSNGILRSIDKLDKRADKIRRYISRARIVILKKTEKLLKHES